VQKSNFRMKRVECRGASAVNDAHEVVDYNANRLFGFQRNICCFSSTARWYY